MVRAVPACAVRGMAARTGMVAAPEAVWRRARYLAGQATSRAPGFGSGSTGNSGAPGSENDAMIVIKVDSEKLPEASDLKAHLFPATLSVQGTDQELRFVSRTAFPDPSVLIGMIPAFGMTPIAPGLGGMPGAPTGAPAAGGEAAAALTARWSEAAGRSGAPADQVEGPEDAGGPGDR